MSEVDCRVTPRRGEARTSSLRTVRATSAKGLRRRRGGAAEAQCGTGTWANGVMLGRRLGLDGALPRAQWAAGSDS